VVVVDVDASADASTNARVARLPWPLSELPLADEDTLGTFGPRLGGYSQDDRYLGYEISTCDPCPSEFVFTSPRAPAIDVSYYYQPQLDEAVQEAQREKHDAAVKKKLDQLGVKSFAESRELRGPFPYPDITFVSKVERAADDSATLWFGAHLPNEEPVYPMHITFAPHPMRGVMTNDPALKKLSPREREKQLKEMLEGMTMSDPILAYANVSKDGQEIGVVAVASGAFWFEAGGVSRMRTTEFVQKVREGTKARAPRH